MNSTHRRSSLYTPSSAKPSRSDVAAPPGFRLRHPSLRDWRKAFHPVKVGIRTTRFSKSTGDTRLRLSISSNITYRQGKEEGSTLATLTLDPQLATMCLHQTIGDGQSQTSATYLLHVIFRLYERFKDQLLF